MSEKTSPESLVGYVYKLTTILGDGQQLEITGNLALDAEVEDMKKQFKKLTVVMDSLAAKHKAEKKKADIAADTAQINAMKADVGQLDATVAEKYKDRKLPTAEANNREAMLRNIRFLEGRVAAAQSDLKVLEEEAK
jgi:hypothetical protein